MVKLDNDTTVITDSELDEMMQLLEVIHAETGNMNVFRIIEIIMVETIAKIQSELKTIN